jgi:hypothetical protein
MLIAARAPPEKPVAYIRSSSIGKTLMTIRLHRVPRIHDNVPWTIA